MGVFWPEQLVLRKKDELRLPPQAGSSMCADWKNDAKLPDYS
jgi:hypothetical protein